MRDERDTMEQKSADEAYAAYPDTRPDGREPETGVLSAESKMRRRQRRRRLEYRRRRRLIAVVSLFSLLLIFLCATVIWSIYRAISPQGDASGSASQPVPDWISQQFLDEGGTSRSGLRLDKVRDIAIHYVGNPGTSAQQNRNYFNNPGVEVNAHFVVGLEGEIIQCIPLDERSSATNERNADTVSIEVCHPDDDGKFSDTTYAAVIKLCAWLCRRYRLDEGNLIRHYDVIGKECPRYYVRHEDAWRGLKEDVGDALRTG